MLQKDLNISKRSLKDMIHPSNKDTKVIKDKKKAGVLDEREIVVSYTNTIIEGKEVPDGNYTVGKNLVTIKNNKVFDIK